MYQNRFFFFAIREAGDPSNRKPYLPSQKQFLITKNGKVELFSVQSFFLLCIVIKFVALLSAFSRRSRSVTYTSFKICVCSPESKGLTFG